MPNNIWLMGWLAALLIWLIEFIVYLVKSQETKTSLDYRQVNCYLIRFYFKRKLTR